MKNISNLFRKSWRAVMTTVFVLLVFTVPASKGVLSKWFNVYAAGGNNQGKNQQNNHDSHSSNSASQTSHGSPSSSPTASPVNPGDSCSTGRRHNDSHHGHHGHAHYRPNGR